MSTFTVNCLDSKAHFETVSFDNIEYNNVNDYSMTSIEELADNIKKNGLLHNIVLSKQKNGKYKILAGERRTRAIRLLHEQEPESWMTTEALVYDGLTEKQEEIIMDSSNLQSRGNGGDEVQLRKATNRYIENMKAEYGLSDKQALKAATDMYSGSGNTIRVNQKIEENLSPEFTEELDSGNIAKGDAAIIADMKEEEQDALFADFQNADDDDEKEEVIKEAVKKQAAKTKADKEKKKASKKKDAKEDPLPVNTSELPPTQKARINYLDKLKATLETIKELNNPDTVAQIHRLDEAEDATDDTRILPIVLNISMETTALKNAIQQSDGDFDAGIDPVYGHHRGNKYEDGYIDGSSWDDDDT